MDLADSTDFDAHEQVVAIADPATGLMGIIAIHSTALGPSIGGCRFAAYSDQASALADALRLSQGMSYKNALAGLAAGGGKAVLHQVGEGADREAIFEAFGSAVQELRGKYVTAQDVGTTIADMEAVSRQTRFVAGLPGRAGNAGGDPSPWTALGVFVSMEASVERPLKGARVAVQGLGAVGFDLCRRLKAAGAALVVADVNPERATRVRVELGAEIVSVDRIHAVTADVFSPNALGGTLNADTISELGAPVVCGGANNQLQAPTDGVRLLARGVTYVPDYVANAGGIINVMAEYLAEPASVVDARVREIAQRVDLILVTSRAEGRPPHEVADRMAQAIIGRRLIEGDE